MSDVAQRARAALLGADVAACLALVPELEAARAEAAGEPLEVATRCVELAGLQGALLDHLVALRLAAVRRVHEALARLRDCPDVATLLPAAARELADAGDFDRTVISRLRGSAWRAEAVWFSPDLDPEVARATRDYLTQTWIPLSRGRLETDLIRRRVPELITADDPRATTPLMDVSRSTGYVASPVLPSGRVIGFLQADCPGSGRTLTAHDRDNLWTFAEGFGLVHERAVLLERLQAQRTLAREAFVRAEAQLEEMAQDEIRLTPLAPEPGRPVAEPFRPVDGSGLTAREREVLALLVTGARNSEIADRLVIGSETVKTHLRGAMRKLGAASRAEAVARYLALSARERA